MWFKIGSDLPFTDNNYFRDISIHGKWAIEPNIRQTALIIIFSIFAGQVKLKRVNLEDIFLKIPPYYLEAAICSGILQFRYINYKLNWSLLRKSELFNISATKIAAAVHDDHLISQKMIASCN